MLSFYIQESMVEMAECTSYRIAESMLNKYLHREGHESFHSRTIADFIEASGSALSRAIERHTLSVLREYNFNPETGLPVDPEGLLPDSIRTPNVMPDDKMIEKIEEAARKYGSITFSVG